MKFRDTFSLKVFLKILLMKTGLSRFWLIRPFRILYSGRTVRASAGKSREKVLEIGTGCGYQTAVLMAMKAHVYTVERQKDLFDFSKINSENFICSQNFRALETGLQDFPLLLPLIKLSLPAGHQPYRQNY
jgi:hypothetical protein